MAREMIYKYQIGFQEFDRGSCIPESFRFHINLINEVRLLTSNNNQERAVQTAHVAMNAIQDELTITSQDFVTDEDYTSTSWIQDMICGIGVPSDVARSLAFRLSDLAYDIINDPEAAKNGVALADDVSRTQVNVVLNVHTVTRYDELEAFEQALAESAADAQQQITTVPATKSSIEALKEVTTTKTTKESCSICLEELSFDDQHDHDRVGVVEMPCSHLYHKDCIVRWLETSHMCPLCRYAMPID